MANIIISGANQGIGYYLTEQLLADGHTVAALDLETEGLAALQKQYAGRLLAYVCDVRDAKAVTRSVDDMIAGCGGVDIAIHNACLCTFASMEDTDEETYRQVFDVNYFGALHLVKAVIPQMKQQKRGKVVFTSSGVGVTGFTKISPYASSKGAIEALAKCLSIEYQGDNITFHLFHPPLTRTRSSQPLPVPQEFMSTPQQVGKGLARRIGRRGFIICHSLGQKLQTKLCYLFPLAFGRAMSKMTSRYEKK